MAFDVVEGDVRGFPVKEFKGVDLLAGWRSLSALLESGKTARLPFHWPIMGLMG